MSRVSDGPNIVDVTVVIATCLIVLVMAFPLSAQEASSPHKQAVKTPGSSSEQVEINGVGRDQGRISIEALTRRLESSKAIGVFTKLEIRNDIVGLVDEIHRYRNQDMLESKLNEVRSSFDGLLLKIVGLLEADPALSQDLYTSREFIWESLVEIKS